MNSFKKNIFRHTIVLLVLGFTSCDTFDSHRHLKDRYYLNYTKFGKCICYMVDNSNNYLELINGEIRAVGLDSNYIVVERNKNEYFIIPIYKGLNYSPEKGILGPLSSNEFNNQKRKLKIKVRFSII